MKEKGEKVKYKKSIKVLLITSAIFILIALVFFLVSLNSDVSEFLTKYWTQPISYLFGHITSLVNFSVFEWTCFFSVLILIIIMIAIIINLIKKNYDYVKKLFIEVVTSIIGVVCIYTSVVTVSYNRKPVPIPQYNNELITDELVSEVYDNFINDFYIVSESINKDSKGQSICPYTFDELTQKIRNEYKNLDEEYFGKYTSKPKYITFSGLMSEFHILGITFTPFGEANVNKQAPYTDIVATMGHELAHTKGVMRENDANLISYYLLLNSEDNYLKYCGYLSVFNIMNYAAKYSNNYDQITIIPEVARRDLLREYNYWNRYNSLNRIGEFFNNLYLKFQGESGTDSYFEYNKAEFDDVTQTYYDVVYTDVQKMVIYLYKNKI